MKNYVHSSDKLTVTAPYALTSGDGCQVGALLFGVAINDAAAGAPAVLQCVGVVKLAKDATALIAGDMVYWDDAAKAATNTGASGANIAIGVATGDAASGDATVTVRLVGQGMPS